MAPPQEEEPGPSAAAIPEELRQLGHYALEKELGRGAQGVVYLAEDVRLRRKVALKVLTNAGARSPEVRERFRREAEIPSKLEHPGLCGVHEVGEENGIPYIAMQYLRGTTLASLIQRARQGTAAPSPDPSASTTSLAGKDAMQDALRVIEQVARALHAAHDAGLVHRDVKPANIMVTQDGSPVVLDFGLARDTEDQGNTITETGQVMGTPAYMAPEQLLGQREAVNRSTDVYALGVVLYECLTLKLPFDATGFELLFQQILEGTPLNPQKLNSRIPNDLRTVIEVAMERDQTRRYATALDFAEDLRRVRTFEPIRAKAAGPWLRARKWARREPAQAVGAAAGLLFVLVGGSVWLGQRWERLQGAREHLLRAESLLAERDFNAALEAVALAREGDPDSTRALEVKAQIERQRELATQAERQRSDLAAAAQARSEAAQMQREHLALRAQLQSLRARLERERAQTLGAFAPVLERSALAELETQYQARLLEDERLLQQSQEALERAARLETPWGGTAETEAAFASFYLERWREAWEAQDPARISLFASLVERYDNEGTHARELLGRGTLQCTLTPASAQAYLFRYESWEQVRPGPTIPRLVPVPTAGVGRVREGAWCADFYPGDKCLVIVEVESGSQADLAGLVPGDLVLRAENAAVGQGLFVVESQAAQLPRGTHVQAIQAVPLESVLDWAQAPPRSDAPLDLLRISQQAEPVEIDRRLVKLVEPKEWVESHAQRLLCLRDGVEFELELSAGERSGLSVERSAYPLILSAENRIEPERLLSVDPGSYLLLVRAEGHETQRWPFRVPRLESVQVRVELLPQESSPPGFVYIPAGSFLSGGDPAAIDPALAQAEEVGAFWIARRELTNAEWAQFVNDPEIQARSAAAQRPMYIPREQNGTPIPSANWGGPDTPVMGISWNEARDYLAWRNRRAQAAGEAWRYDLPSEAQWEKAARGVDARHFPWGNRFDFSLVIGLHSRLQALFAAPGGLEIADESPYGVQDLAGLRQEWTSVPRLVDASAPPAYAVRGGCWIHPRDSFFRAASRNWQDASVGGGRMGLRLVAQALR